MAKFLPPAAAAAAYRVSADHLADVVAAYREVADILDAAVGSAPGDGPAESMQSGSGLLQDPEVPG